MKDSHGEDRWKGMRAGDDPARCRGADRAWSSPGGDYRAKWGLGGFPSGAVRPLRGNDFPVGRGR